ncbi:response regulator receiver modulated diguanylate cyclase/phosphodiesterase with PAS/PAC sensor(s) [Oxalobacteraceae bacterium IMCC9480]|nr:response regulator receiver modulated diguanylate cyclase/phosphodiesterase with PAS/PAC sensor(s) [Oxalobacteraceae bacterium IMCC9480]
MSTVVLVLCVGTTLLAIIGQTWWTIRVDRGVSIEQIKKDQLTTIRSIEEHAFQTIQDADRAISASIEAIEADGGLLLQNPAALRQVLIRERQNTTQIQSLRFISPAGISSVTTFEDPMVKIDISDRTHVRQIINDPASRKVHIGPPVKSRYDGKWVLPVIRNIHGTDGTRLGMLCAYLTLDYFDEYYHRIAEGRQATVSMHSDEGIVMIDWPFDARRLGEDISTNAGAIRIQAGSREGFFESVEMNDSAEPVFLAYRKLAALPLTVVYTYRLHEALLPWQQRTSNRLLFSGAITGLILLLTLLLLQHIRRLHRSEEHLAANENRYRMLYESATDAILLINHRHEYVDCNPAALILFDVANKNQLIGKRFEDAMPSVPRADGKQHSPGKLLSLALDGQSQLFEWAMLRKGVPFFNEITLSRAHINNEELLVAVFRDINARKRAELLQESQNQLLHMISAGIGLQPIVHAITQFLARHAPGTRSMVLLVDAGLPRFSSAIGAGFTVEFLDSAARLEIVDHATTMSEAVLTRAPAMSAGPATSAAAFPGRCSSWPILAQRGQILGVLSIFQLPKDHPGSELMQLIDIAIDLASITIESRYAEQRIRRLAHYDELTGLPNRVLCGQQLDKALLHAQRHGRQVGVLFIDLDRFKNINETFGHDAGDTVLREVSLRFLDTLRPSDLIARAGGDEFIVLVDGYDDPLELGDIARHLLQVASRPFAIAGQECQLGASIGIASFPQDGHSAQVLLKNADIAMHRAKDVGKNNVQYYSIDMHTHSVERLALEARLQRAIERRELVIHYQPKIDVMTGRITGAEALVRWNHPERGLLHPAEFIDLAEDTGLIGALGMLVLDATCADINDFRLAGIEVGRIAINLSGSQFNDTRLLDHMLQVIRTRQVDPSSLEFEITEGMVMHKPEQAIALMEEMIRLGFTLAIDDFGTGYSSLAYLKRFPVGSVKIDKSFINDIPDDPNDSAIVQAIIVMARTLGMKVVAEGVETRTQLATLEAFGCDEYQGYFFSKPVAAADFIALARGAATAR